MLWDRYWRGRELDVFMSTYYTVLPVRVPSVCVVHDMIFELFPGSFDKTLATETLEKQRRAIAKADRLICVSECTRQDVIKIHQVDASKCRVVYHASGIMRKVPDGEKNSKEFLYVGDILSKYKNFEFLIRCLGSPEFSEFGEYKLRVVSTCELNATDMSRFSEYLPTARMQFVANCTDDELAGYYATCAAFIYPSLYEGFGIPILEALSYGAPVVSSTGGALPEAGGEVVYYFDPKSEDGLREALRRALADGRAPQLVKKRKEHAGRFSWDKTAEKFLAVLREVAGEKKSVKCKV
jgi:glycosyltransferase involved in cell wall biosynthesis